MRTGLSQALLFQTLPKGAPFQYTWFSRYGTMEEIRIQGLCLSTLSVGEADLLLTILSQDQGLIKVYAKGIQRPSRRADLNACRPGCVAEWSVRKGRGELLSFLGADLLYYPDALYQQWEQLHDVLSMFQAICQTQWVGKPIPALYALTLTFMRQAELDYHPALLPCFLLKLLVHDGVFPQPHVCQVCEKHQGPWGWSETGGLLCPQHANPEDPLLCTDADLARWEELALLKSFEAIRQVQAPPQDTQRLAPLVRLLLHPH